MKTQITRTAFCKRCFDEERPKTGNFYLVKGSSGLHVYIIDYAHPHENPRGFVPTIFTLDSSSDGLVHTTQMCGMHTCGVEIRNNPDYETNTKAVPYLIYKQEQKKITMTVANWNALVLAKDFGYKLE